MASTVRAVEDLVIEYREVQRETEADGVSGGKLSDGNVRSGLVGFQGLVRTVFPLVAGRELGEVSVVITHPVNEKVV